MCGICGFFSRKFITEQQLREMNDTMFHRGPDDGGEEIFETGTGWQVGLAQRRLSILDLSPAGHQPMHSPDGRLSIVFNGEIYNYPELKRELTGYAYRSSTDTEVILAAYEKWGEDCVHHFNGMFAAVIYDRQDESLFLFRDPAGKKPLYYWLEDWNLVFASECKPIMKYPGFPKTVRRDILARYLYQQYIAEPDTVFRNVWQLEPGTSMVFRNGEIRKEKYWSVPEVYERNHREEITDYAAARAGLKTRLQQAARRRLLSDVPLGAFLSGGYDSSLVCALAQEQLHAPLKTFSVGFQQKEYDEAVFAAEVAAHLGTEHTAFYVGEQDMLDMVESIPRYFDIPMADSSQIPTMLVSRLAREKVTVALSGDGGDEFFCGYGLYDRVRQAQKLDLAGSAAHLLGQIPWGGTKLEEHFPVKARIIAGNRDPRTKGQFGLGTYAEAISRMVPGEGIPMNYPVEDRYPSGNWQIRRMLLDMEHYLPGDILCKVDRAAMKYSLETRCPILDKEVMEYSFRIPHGFKYRNGEKKAILKDIVTDYIPKDMLERPKKGFSVPLDQWLRGPLREQLQTYASAGRLEEQGWFDGAYVEKRIGEYLQQGDGGAGSGANFSRVAWAFFVFQQWVDYYL